MPRLPDTVVAAGSDAPGRATTFASRYVTRRLLGTGGSEGVWLCLDQRLDREVAVSLLRAPGAVPGEVERMRREARLMARLGEHAHIVTVHDYGVLDNVPYLVSQYMAGGSVADLLAKQPRQRLARRLASG